MEGAEGDVAEADVGRGEVDGGEVDGGDAIGGDDPALWAARIALPPAQWALAGRAGTSITLLPAHRRRYLWYEGRVADGRGSVERVDEGHVRIEPGPRNDPRNDPRNSPGPWNGPGNGPGKGLGDSDGSWDGVIDRLQSGPLCRGAGDSGGGDGHGNNGSVRMWVGLGAFRGWATLVWSEEPGLATVRFEARDLGGSRAGPGGGQGGRQG